MIAEGLLWFDDDSKRPVTEKIAYAVERYSERTGWRPTVCETNPSQVDAYNAEAERAANPAAAKRASKAHAAPMVELPAGMRVVANSAMRPNCFLIGIGVGERPRKAAAPTTHGAAHKAAMNASTASHTSRASRKKAS